MFADDKKRGFTLLELLVVIAIIGVLSSAIMFSVTEARKKARDSRRIQDIRQVILALELYRSTNGRYPEEEDSGGFDFSDTDSNSNGNNWIDELATSGFMKKMPLDPINKVQDSTYYRYRYYKYAAGTNGCDSNRGDFYVLGIDNMEFLSGTQKHPQSPGFSCSGRNWETETQGPDWVTGGYER
jgi:general secretion pathway protein G